MIHATTDDFHTGLWSVNDSKVGEEECKKVQKVKDQIIW